MAGKRYVVIQGLPQPIMGEIVDAIACGYAESVTGAIRDLVGSVDAGRAMLAGVARVPGFEGAATVERFGIHLPSKTKDNIAAAATRAGARMDRMIAVILCGMAGGIAERLKAIKEGRAA